MPVESSGHDASTVALMIKTAEERTARPDEPTLPPLQWMGKNLFGTGQGSGAAVVRSTLLTAAMTFLGLYAYRAILNFVFSEQTNWDSVRVNLRLLFTQAYPSENYDRVWLCLAIVFVLGGISLGMMRVGQGISLKRISTWAFTWGSFVVLGVLLREPSVETDALGNAVYTDPDGVPLFTGGLGTLVYENGDPAPSQGLVIVRESFADAIAGRTGWLLIGALLLGVGAAIWFGAGDRRRRATFVPAIPLGLAGIGLLVSSTWWYDWGNYAFVTDEETGATGFVLEPGVKVATSTRDPWTLLFVVLVVAYVVGRRARGSARAGTVRSFTNIGWLLSPFVTYWAILRAPQLDWNYVFAVDVPLWLAFTLGGAALLWFLTRPGIGELGRLLAVAILAIAAFTWVGAFFGWFGMLQKVRFAFLILGLAGLLAPNFIGEARQRLRLVFGWIGLSTVFHVLVTLINTPSGIEVPTEDFAGGFLVSVYITIFTLLFSFPLGVLLALARTSRLPIFRVMATAYIESFRGVPLITMLFFFTVFVNLFLPDGMELSLFAAVTVAFVLFSAAYLAENVRGGLQSVMRGQYEASDAMGLTTVQRTGFIVLPQALRVSIPPLVGQVIATFKETSLLAIVGVFDFLFVARNVIPTQTEFIGELKPALLFICVVYFVFAYSTSKYSQRLERQLGVGER